MFQSSNLPLSKWFLALFLMTQSKNNVAALELMRWLGVCYRTAWRMKHKLMNAMQEREHDLRLEGRIEVDDAYLGGEKMGGKVGRGSENKVAFVAAVESELDGTIRRARFDPVAGFGQEPLRDWSQRALQPGAHVVSDGLWGFATVKQQQCSHEVHKGVEARLAVKRPALQRVNTLLGNLKTALSGTYHAFKFKKYAARYLGEYQYRFNRRFDLAAMLPRLLVACVAGTYFSENQLRFNDVDQRPQETKIIRLILNVFLCCCGGVKRYQFKPHGGRAFVQVLHNSLMVPLFVIRDALIDIVSPFGYQGIDEARQFMGRCRDGPRFVHASAQASIIGAQCGLTVA